MAEKNEHKITGRVAEDVLTRFPSISNLGAAKIMFKENPLLFTNVEAARNVVRHHRGAHGTESRKYATYAPSPYTTLKFDGFPEGEKEHETVWEPMQIQGSHKTLILSDAHIPYHEREPLLLAVEYGKKHRANTIILNGDIADFFAVSFWENDPNKRNLVKELKTVREFLHMLRQTFPQARIIYKLGNHEERWKRFIIRKAHEVYGVEEFSIGSLLQLSKHRIELVDDCRPIRLGKLNVLHGHEYRFAISNPVNPARGLFLRCKSHAIAGHFHQSSYHTEKTVEGQAIATWSTGCLCSLHPDYRPLNNWGYGFAYVETENNGNFIMDHKVIRGGKIY
jgi:predicted phosphodiesterase